MTSIQRKLLLTCLLGFTSAPILSAEPDPQTSVIYFIGDGMGPNQITLGRLGAQRLGIPHHLERFQVTGLVSTSSADNLVTDSAAAGTALASGIKTRNQTIGQDPEGRPVTTILDVAHEAGYRTGVVTNTRVTHATPAAFTAHCWHRDEEGEIARQQSHMTYPEVLIGGGARSFREAEQDRLRGNGYTVITDPNELAGAKGDKLAAFLHRSHLPYQIDRVPGTPRLKELVSKGVEILAQGGKPFVLVVEGGKIDHAGHDHDAAAMIHEQLDFDEALGWALDYLKQSPNTLVVATADHATGGLAISEDATITPLLRARSSMAEMERRVRKRTGSTTEEVTTRIVQREVLSAHSEVELTVEEVQAAYDHDSKYWWVMRLGHTVSKRRGISFYEPEWQHVNQQNTHGHDGGLVSVFAQGKGAERFMGMFENTQIPLRIAEVLGLAAPGKILGQPAEEKQGSILKEEKLYYVAR